MGWQTERGGALGDLKAHVFPGLEMRFLKTSGQSRGVGVA